MIMTALSVILSAGAAMQPVEPRSLDDQEAWVVTQEDAVGRIPGDPRFAMIAQGQGAAVLMYAPTETDDQTPHTRDEVYIIASGGGYMTAGEKEFPVSAGDLVFVPAHLDHRFFDFTHDFQTWVIFYGEEKQAQE